VHIFKFFIFVSILFGQNNERIFKSIQFNQVNDSLKKMLNNELDWKTEYILHGYSDNPDSSIYKVQKSDRIIDSVLIKTEDIITNKVLQQIISNYKYKSVSHNFSFVGKKLISEYYFLNNIPDHQFGLIDTNKIALIIDINPKFENNFSGFLGLNKQRNKLSVEGESIIHLENYFKQAESFNLFWRKTDSISQKISFDLFFPHPFGWNTGIVWNYYFEIINGLYTYSETNYAIRTFSSFLHNLQFGYLKGSTTPTLNGEIKQYKKNEVQAFSIISTKDTRNNRILPTQGIFIENNINFGTQNTSSFIDFGHEVQYYYLIKKNIFLKTQIIAEGIYDFKKRIPLSRYKKFGGTSTLRGFNENQFFNTQFQILTFETGYSVAPSIQTKLFFDIASKDLNLFDNYLIGYGFGLYQVNNNSLVQIEYALSNLTPSQGKIHFKWITRF
jgi:hypothetical protein